MTKFIKGDRVAVLYSPGYGAGWSTWNQDYAEDIIFDPVIARLVDQGLDTTQAQLEQYLDDRYPDGYWGGLRDLTIKWVPAGARFRIEEYDGRESVIVEGDDVWFVA